MNLTEPNALWNAVDHQRVAGPSLEVAYFFVLGAVVPTGYDPALLYLGAILSREYSVLAKRRADTAQ